MSKYTPRKHQQETINFYRKNDRAFDASTMGTGKTFCGIHDVVNRLYANPKSKTLILAPKSLLETVWQNDFNKFAPHIITSVAVAPEAKRLEAFNIPANVYITNIDALVWLSNKPDTFWDDYETIIIDESTSIKNDSGRTKAALKIRKYFKYRRCLSGTPTAGLLTDLFYQYLFLDDGATLGTSFTKFRNQVLISKQTGPHPKMVTWSNKPGREKVLAYMLKPITIRHILEDVIDMPPTVKYTYKFKLNKTMRKAYEEMKNSAQVTLDTGTVNAVNAAALTTKLLQCSSGAIYDSETGEKHLVDTQRYNLVLDLVQQTKHSVVFYNWRSQREYMTEHADKRKITYAFIDGSVSFSKRKQIVNDYQAGKYDTIFLQLKSSSHGLTLTKATHTIWTCPSYLSDYYKQANHRVYRMGQTKRTTIINIEAENTLDHIVYEKLDGKLTAMELLTEAL